MSSVLSELRWKKFPVLDDGFVCLVDCMGDDSSVVQAARVSYGKDVRDESVCRSCGGTGSACDNFDNFPPQCAACKGTGKVEGKSDNRTLLRYLMRHRHTTPFEMAEVKFLVRVPMDCWRQWIRHRTANVNEYSTRYAEAIDSQQKTPPDEWRSQSTSNKQGSGNFLTEWPPGTMPEDGPPSTPGQHLSNIERGFHARARAVYEERLALGVAKEQARKDLPLSTYTEAYWKCDLNNILHFLGLRMDKHAQLEIRLYANTIGEIIKQLFPVTWEAFEDYRLQGMHLTRLDIMLIDQLTSNQSLRLRAEDVVSFIKRHNTVFPDWQTASCRERDEAIAKLQRMGLVRA